MLGLLGMPRRIYTYDKGGPLGGLQPDLDDRLLRHGGGNARLRRQHRPDVPSATRRSRPLARRHARVVRDLAAAARNFDVIPRVRSARADEGHPPRDRAAHLGSPASGAATVPSGSRQLGVSEDGTGDRRCSVRSRLVETQSVSAIPALGGLPSVLAAESAQLLLRDYVELTKPQVMSLLLLTTVASIFVAGDPTPLLRAADLLGGYRSAGGAGAVNHYLDRDIDELMGRTADRPVASGRSRRARRSTFGCSLAWRPLVLLDSPSTSRRAPGARRASSATCSSTPCWLKRRTPQNIVIGGAAGAVPPLVGWAAVDGLAERPGDACFLRSSSSGRRRTSGRWRC